MDEVKIVYIDDHLDTVISKYMRTIYCSQNSSNKFSVKKDYAEIIFNGDEGYESLLNDSRVREANLILIDNRLFEQRDAKQGKFSGTQFKVILRKLFPFIEVIVITQDEKKQGHKIIHKFNDRYGESSDDHYNKELLPALDNAISEVISFEELSKELTHSEDVERTLIEKVLLSLQGDDTYDELRKADIDALIAAFKELEESVEGQ